MNDRLKTLADTLMPIPGSVLVGVSGGADSVALLRMLLLNGCRVQAVHVNHGLRGEASDGDEQFVSSLCDALNVPLLIRRAIPPAHPSEDWARQARYGFFREAMAQTGCDTLALAHHRDDQAETLLLHLLRGSGLTGLTGMRADTVVDGLHIVRPLLHLTRAELRQALLEAGQPWREDASNEDPKYLRNAVRTQLLPMMEQLAPGSTGRIAATANLLQADEAALAVQTQDFLTEASGSRWIKLAPLQAQPLAMQRRLLRAWWQQHTMQHGEHTLSHAQTDALTSLVNGHAAQRCNLPDRWSAVRGWQCLHLVAPNEPRPCAAPVPVTETGAVLDGISLTAAPSCGTPGNGQTEQELPASWLAGCELRYRQTGDWLRPFGSSGRQSLQDYLVNRRIDAPFRDRIPLLCRGQEVLLVCGVGAGAVPEYDPQENNIRLSWHGDMPWR